MAETKVTDIIIPEVFLPYLIERTAEKSALIQSGIVQMDAEFDKRASEGGDIVNMPFWQDLTGDDEVLSDATPLSVNKIDTAQDMARKHQRGKAFGANDLAKHLSGDDPMAAIADLIADYRQRRLQVQLVSTLKGIFGAASMAGSLNAIHKVSGTPTSANFLTGETFIQSTQKMGDQKDKLSGVMMHSAVESALRILDLIDYEPDSQGGKPIAYFQGHRVIVDDTIDTVTVDSKLVYSTYVGGEGALALGFSNRDEPVEGGHGSWMLEYGRDALAGSSHLINRWRNILHPRGIAWQEASVAGESPTNAEIATAANWVRVFEQKNVRIVKVSHNIPTL